MSSAMLLYVRCAISGANLMAQVLRSYAAGPMNDRAPYHQDERTICTQHAWVELRGGL